MGEPLPTYRAVGAYIFAGAFTIGVREAGFEVEAHLEGNSYGVDSARANFPGLPVFVGDWPIEDLAANPPDLVYCNPPCALFSTMGRATTRGPGSWRNDERLQCWKDCFLLLERVRPRALAIESVTQAYGTGREFIDELTRWALAYGYCVTHLLLDAAYLGIPQHRQRFFFIAHEPGRFFPQVPDFDRVPTVGEALALVPYDADREPCDESGTRKLHHVYEHAELGERLVDAWNRLNPPETRELNEHGKVKGRPSFQDRRLDPNRPMGAFTGDKFWHPTEPRKLGPDEMKALGGYPLDFRLNVNRREMPSLLARAVMPPVGEWLARSLRTHFATNDSTGHPLRDERTVFKVDVRKRDKARDDAHEDLTGEYVAPNGKPRVRPPPPNASVVIPVRGEADPGPRGSKPPTHDAPAKGQNKNTSSSRGTTIPASAVDTKQAPPPSDAPPGAGEGSGRYIMRLLRTGRYTPDEIVAKVHENFENRRTKRSDVYYNKRKLWTDFGIDVGERTRPNAPAEVDTRSSSVAVKPRALVTGMTPSQCGSTRTRLKLLTSATAWANALRAGGYEVEHRVVDVGEDLSAYEVVLVGLSKPNAIAAGQAFSGLYALNERPDAVVYVDDWQVGDILPGFQTYSRDHARIWRLDRRGRDAAMRGYDAGIEATVDRFADPAGWPGRLLVPTHGTGGDLTRLGAPTYCYGVDPTELIERWPVPEPRQRKQRRWLWASLVELGDKMVEDLEWPVDRFGNKGAGKGGVGKTKAADNRVEEPALVAEYDRRWGCLAPPHPDAGSGWWRVRYLMARDTGTVVSAPRDDAELFGEAYVEAADPRRVEGWSEPTLKGCARDQAAELDAVTTQRDVAIDAFFDTIGR